MKQKKAEQEIILFIRACGSSLRQKDACIHAYTPDTPSLMRRTPALTSQNPSRSTSHNEGLHRACSSSIELDV